MNDDPRQRDPLDPRDPAADRDPRVVNQTAVSPGSGRGGLALAAVLAALLVIGFIAFTGNNEGVDPNPTAATGTDTQEVLPGTTQPETTSPGAAPDATQTEPATPPAAAPQENNPAGTGTAPSE